MPEAVETHTERIIDKAMSLVRRNTPFEQYPENIKEYFNRWRIAHDILYEFSHRGRNFILNLYKARFPDLSDTQARLDIRASQMVFGRMSRDSYQFYRTMAIERLNTQASIAQDDHGDRRGYAAIEAVLYRHLNPKNDPIDAPDWEELLNNVRVTIMFNPELLGVTPMSEEAVKKLERSVLRKKRKEFIEDAEFEEIEEKQAPLDPDKLDEQYA